jgi:hypothetical protein
MDTELSFKTAVCTESERLRSLSQKALEIWRNRREEFTRFGLSGKIVADELLRLQANYAKAYSRLEKHGDDCELCLFDSKIGGRSYVSNSNAILGRECHA